MFNPKPSSNASGLSDAIDEMLVQLHEEDENSDVYAGMVDQLAKLYALKEIDHKITSPSRIDVNTLVLASANVIGILAIVGHERTNIITSKAVGLLMKLK